MENNPISTDWRDTPGAFAHHMELMRQQEDENASRHRSPRTIDRLDVIGGSDIAAVMGVSRWKTPLDVYMKMNGQGNPVNSEAAYWGTLLEDIVAQEYTRRSGRRVQRIKETMVHPEHDYAVATIDRAVVDKSISGRVTWRDGKLSTSRILECKTASAHVARDWGDPGTDQLPIEYLCQVQWYMGITGVDVADVAVLIGGNDFRIYSVERDDAVIEHMLAAAGRFIERFRAGIAPEPKTIDDARALWPHHIAGKIVEVGSDIAQMCADVAALAESRAELESQEDDLRARIMAAMGDAEEIRYNGERLATWKTQTSKRLDTSRIKREHPAIVDQYTVATQSRVFRLTKREVS